MRKSIGAIAWVLSLLAVQALWAADEPPDSDAAKPAKFCVVGYLPSYEMKSFDPSIGETVTDLIYFSIQPTAAGDVDHDEVTPEALERLHELQRRHGTRIEVAIGGWGKANSFAPVALDREKRRRFVDALARYCRDNQLDGVDFDWEFPKGADEQAAYSTLLVETKAAMSRRQLLVTVALNASQSLSAEAYQAVDRVHLMAYNHAGKEHSTFEQARADVEQLLARGVPKEKLILGLPFYGRNPRGKPKAMNYARIVSRFQPGADDDSAGGYYFNGMATIRKKTRFAAERGIGGVMIWELGQDARDETSLLRAIGAAVRGK